MRITVLDTETTGLEQSQGHRIIEVCMKLYDSESRTCLKTLVQRINPQRSIEPAAQAVHGIALSELLTCPTWDTVAPTIQKWLKVTDLLVAHNMSFDGPFVALELMRVGLEVPNVESFCTMENARWATDLGKLPTLRELCFALRVPYDEALAHAAEYDVDRTAQCLFAGIDRGFYTLPVITKTA